jgi:hypothetical protein
MAHEATAATGPVSPCQNHPPSPQLPNMARELLKMLVMSVAKDPRVSLSPAANGPNDTRAESTLCPVPNEAPIPREDGIRVTQDAPDACRWSLAFSPCAVEPAIAGSTAHGDGRPIPRGAICPDMPAPQLQAKRQTPPRHPTSPVRGRMDVRLLSL